MIRTPIGVMALLLLSRCFGGVEQTAAPLGVIVTEVVAGYAGDRAGLRPGDRITSWEVLPHEGTPLGRGSSTGKLEGPADWRLLELDHAPLESLRLEVSREDRFRSVTLPPGEWRTRVRPAALTKSELSSWRDEGGVSVEPTRALATRLGETDRAQSAAWVLVRAAARLLEEDRIDAAMRLVGEARDVARAAGSSDLALWVELATAESLIETNRPAAAAAAYERAHALVDGSNELRGAAVLYGLGFSSFRQSQYPESLEHLDDALRIWEEEAPETLPHASALLLAGKANRNLGRWEETKELMSRALAIARQRDPGGPMEATVLYERGAVAEWRGELAQAHEHYEEAAAIHGRLGVTGTEAAMVQMGLGNVAWYRGDLSSAEERFLRARQNFERHAPGTLFEAWSLQNLGLVAQQRAELDSAEDFFRQSLTIRESHGGSDTTDVAFALEHLGEVAEERGDLDEARALVERALSIHEKRAPKSVMVARLQESLGELATKRGELEKAERHLGRSLSIRESIAPGSLDHASTLFRFATLEEKKKNLDRARALHERGLAIRRRLAPGSLAEAESLHALGLLTRKIEGDAEALPLLEAAVDALEIQHGRLGGSLDERSVFASRYGFFFKELIETQLSTSRPEEAFATLESYRARGLRALLAARELNLDAELPEPLRQRRRELARAYDQAQAELAELDDTSPPEVVERHLAELRGLQRRRHRLDAEVERASPRLSALESDRVLGLDRALEILDPGTLVLSYSMHRSRGYLFALGPAPKRELEVFPLSITDEALRREVERFRLGLQASADDSLETVHATGHSLYRELVAPAAELVESSERILFVPDGALHALPFAGLVTEPTRYLVQSRPIHSVVSLTVYEKLRNRERKALGRMVAFGNPAYESASNPEIATLPPLPGSRREVETIAELVPGSIVYLGEEATESRVKSLSGRLDYLHFATHAVVDERFPLDSFLALSAASSSDAEQRDNGLLQAWEIFEQLRVDVDLVTLSACETALGKELGGEGLVGLTRAFQYAGARSVAASLWRVPDRATSAFMTRFYTYLTAGETKSDAMRQAQLDLLEGTPAETPTGFLSRLLDRLGLAAPEEDVDLTHPRNWAAFQLQGDWR